MTLWSTQTKRKKGEKITAEVKWIKIVTDVFDNRKIRMIESLPDGDALIVIWFKILTLAGQVNEGGQLYLPIRSTMLAKANATAAAPSRPNVLPIRSTKLAKANATAAAPSRRTSFPSAVRS